MNSMNDMSKWINSIADEVDKAKGLPADDMLSKIANLTARVKERKGRQAEIDRQRDELIRRIADALGIDRDDYLYFFETVE